MSVPQQSQHEDAFSRTSPLLPPQEDEDGSLATSLQVNGRASRALTVFLTVILLVATNLHLQMGGGGSGLDLTTFYREIDNLFAVTATNTTLPSTTASVQKAAVLTAPSSASAAQPLPSSIQWTVMTTINHAYLEMFYNWFHFYQKLKLDLDLILVAEDDVVWKELQQFQIAYYQKYSNSNNVTVTIERSDLHIAGAVNESYGWSDEKYTIMMSARPRLIRQKLQEGRHLIFTDVDTVWQHNPLPYFDNFTVDFGNETHDMNRYHLFSSMDPRDQRCGGFWAMTSSEPTIRM
ncbi:MAG: hypothetical protein SGARI_005772, partial [Bacillariaceae sp.]